MARPKGSKSKSRVEGLREQLLAGCRESVNNIALIAQGRAEITVLKKDKVGNAEVVCIGPTFTEQIAAFEVLAKYGAGQAKEQVTNTNGATETVVYTFD